MNSFKFKIKGIENEISYMSIFLTVAVLVCLVLLTFGLVTLLEIKKAWEEVKEFIK